MIRPGEYNLTPQLNFMNSQGMIQEECISGWFMTDLLKVELSILHCRSLLMPFTT